MPGEAPRPPGADPQDEGTAVQCPVHRVEITPCDAAELAPLLAHLGADLVTEGQRRFPRGTLIDDGRLDLCKQSLGSENCLRVTQALEHNTRVRSLMLGTDAIGEAGAVAVARLATLNPHLEVIYLGCNNIGPDGARDLGAALEQAGQVSGLWLKRNPLGPDGARSIARMLRANRTLRVLDLVNTDLRVEGVQALVDALCTANRGLRSLYLSGNGLGPPAAAACARLLREAPQVEALYLSVNRLGDEGAALLADGLAANRTLQTLELASNGIGPEGARALFAAARSHPALRCLNLGYAPSTKVLGAQANRLGEEGAGHAAACLREAPALRMLDLSRNGITAHGLALLAEAASVHPRLTGLVVDGGLPAPVAQHLARNLADQGGPAVGADQALIKSVYR